MKRFSRIIFMVFGLFIAYVVFTNQAKVREDMDLAIRSFQIYMDNVQYKSNPPRPAPMEFETRAEELKMKLRVPFVKFSPADWKKFWDLVYKTFVLEPSTDDRLPRRYRQLTLAEIEQRLMIAFPEFNYYQSTNWAYMWREILKVK